MNHSVLLFWFVVMIRTLNPDFGKNTKTNSISDMSQVRKPILALDTMRTQDFSW